MRNALHQKTWLSWSSGKDSYASLRALEVDDRYEVDALFTVVDLTTGRIPMHAVSATLLDQQVRALGLKHHLVPIRSEDQAAAMRSLIEVAQSNGASCFAFGDLFLDDVRTSRERNMVGTGIETVFPLWQKPTEELILELITDGMRAVITSVDLAKLPVSFLGRELTPELVEDLTARGCDPCGENGEYHSFVFDGPLFSDRVRFERGELTVGTEFAHLPLLPGDATTKCTMN